MKDLMRQGKDGLRHQLIGESFYDANPLPEEEVTLEGVLADLQTALQLELSTIPPYLCALYSIQSGTNLAPVEIIKSVVIEEMLHMVMVANLINSIGGSPVMNTSAVVPSYPTKLPGGIMPQLTVGLGHFSMKTIMVFEKIEHPEGELQFEGGGNTSIGTFYEKVKEQLKVLEEKAQEQGETIFCGTTQQVTGEHYYGAGGKLIVVSNLKDAEDLIDEIVGQGEGTLGSIWADQTKDPEDYKIFGTDVTEIAHYFRFKEIRYGRYYKYTDSAHRNSHNAGLPSGARMNVDWTAVSQIAPVPKMADYEDDPLLYQKAREFNLVYMALLDNLQEACTGNPDALKTGIPIMYDLRYKAEALLNIPYGTEGYKAAPTFEFIEPADRA